MIHSATLIGLFTLQMSLCAVRSERVPVEDSQPLPEGGVPLLEPDAVLSADLTNNEELPVEVKTVDVSGQPFKKAVQVKTEKPTAEWWAIQLVMPTIAPVQKGDALLATFYMRCIETLDETGEAYVRALFETERAPFNKSIVAQYGATRNWRKIHCAFTAIESSDAGGSVFNFAIPAGPQVVQLGGLMLTNYGVSVTDTALPRTVVTYPGRELDAPWRESAARRIDKFRKADLRVTVRGPDGKPAPGARVVAAMTRHGFPFGTAVSVAAADGRRFGSSHGKRYWFTPKDEQEYDYWVKRWFTKLTPEVALMPNGWTGVWNNLGREVAIEAVKKYHAQGYDIRGHILVWPGWKWFRPPGIELVKDDPEKLARFVIDHVTDETATLKEWVDEWTLLNEPFAHHDIMDVVGNDAMVDWFKAGHQANPDALLYINDYSILSGGGVDVGHQDHYAKTIQFLLDKGAPMHGIGFQGHFGDDPTGPEKVYQIIERFAKFGKEMQITEFDVNTRDNQLQADYTRDFMTICFSHPGIVAFSFWGFWENAHWRSDAAMIDANWLPKPSGEAFEQLVLHDWWTEEEGETNKKGQFKIRGFLGDYQITVRSGAITKHVDATLKPGGSTIEITMAPEPVRSPVEQVESQVSCRTQNQARNCGVYFPAEPR